VSQEIGRGKRIQNNPILHSAFRGEKDVKFSAETVGFRVKYYVELPWKMLRSALILLRISRAIT